MKSSSIFLLVAFFCLAHAKDPTPKEDNYRKELLELYNWTKTEFKPHAITMLNLSCQAAYNITEDPRLFEGQDPAIIQPFVDKVKQAVSNFEEAKKLTDSEEFMEKTMLAFQAVGKLQWREGLTESAVEHLDSIKEESYQKIINAIEAALEKSSKGIFDKFVARVDETISKLTPSAKEAHPDLTRWSKVDDANVPDTLAYFSHPWRFLFWAYDQLNGPKPSNVE